MVPILFLILQKFDESNEDDCHIDWKVVVKAQEVSFAAMIIDGSPMSVVSLTGLYYNGATDAQVSCYPFGSLLSHLYEELSTLDRWKDTV